MGNDRLISDRDGAKFNSKSGDNISCLISQKNNADKPVKSQLVKRSADDLKRSRVAAYNYLIP
jgi:hypothetical protein